MKLATGFKLLEEEWLVNEQSVISDVFGYIHGYMNVNSISAMAVILAVAIHNL